LKIFSERKKVNMKKLIYSLAIGAMVFTTACGDQLDTQNIYDKNQETFYRSPQDIDEAMNGVYNALYVATPSSNEHIATNLLSDVILGGGGPDDIGAKNIDAFKDPTDDTYRDLWIETYNGVSRANAVIEAVPDADFARFFASAEEAEAYKKSALGEAYFMRGFMMYRAARFFGGMPLIPTTESPRDVPRSSLGETWAFIASDFVKAADLLEKKQADAFALEEYGHTNVWAAKGYLARAYLYYTGYMTNIQKQATDALPLTDGGSVTKADVVSHLEDVINNSGYRLADDFRNLWPYSYVNQSARQFNPEGDHPVLPWAENEGLEWVGQDGPNSQIGTGNYEVMFAQRFAFGNWEWDDDTGQKYNNRVALFFGIRDHSMIPFGQGWGWGPVHAEFFNRWDDSDLRKTGSVLNLNSKDPDMGLAGWNTGKGDQNTGLMNKKYTTLQHTGVRDDAASVQGMFYWIYGWTNGDPMQLWAAQDYYYLRYADILLMHSELTGTADGMNEVRERAGLDPLEYSLENLKEERLHEFAFEGVRWFDLVRWGDVENDNNYYSVPSDVNNSGTESTYQVSYRPEIKGLMPIPESEIRLSNGVYEQNAGW
jgi:hypothetical protein